MSSSDAPIVPIKIFGSEPRRRYRRCEDLPEAARVQVCELYRNGSSHKSIADALFDLGYQVTWHAVKEYCDNIPRTGVIMFSADSFNKDADLQEIEIVLIRQIYHKLQAILLTLGASERDIIQYKILAETINRLSMANANRTRISIERLSLLKKVEEEFKKEIQLRLSGRPDLAAELAEISDGILETEQEGIS